MCMSTACSLSRHGDHEGDGGFEIAFLTGHRCTLCTTLLCKKQQDPARPPDACPAASACLCSVCMEVLSFTIFLRYMPAADSECPDLVSKYRHCVTTRRHISGVCITEYECPNSGLAFCRCT